MRCAGSAALPAARGWRTAEPGPGSRRTPWRQERGQIPGQRVSHGADVARAHGHEDVAIADHVLERAGKLLDLFHKQRLENSAAAHGAADGATSAPAMGGSP